MSVHGIMIDYTGKIVSGRRWQLEIERLSHHLRQYDVCFCGYERREHRDGTGCPCGREFECCTPADPLETVSK